MKQTRTLSNTDRTTWSRIAMVWKFYLPYTRRKLYAFAAISTLIEVCILLAADNMPKETVNTLVKMASTLLTVLIGCSALVFAKPKGRELQAMLPALGTEKCIVIVGYVTIIIPLIAVAPTVISYVILGDSHPSVLTLNENATMDNIHFVPAFVFSLLLLEGMALTCLWGVIACRGRAAMRNGLLAAGGVYLASMMLTALTSFCIGFYAAVTGKDIQISDTLFQFLSIICAFYVIFALIKSCRAIKRGQY